MYRWYKTLFCIVRSWKDINDMTYYNKLSYTDGIKFITLSSVYKRIYYTMMVLFLDSTLWKVIFEGFKFDVKNNYTFTVILNIVSC